MCPLVQSVSFSGMGWVHSRKQYYTFDNSVYNLDKEAIQAVHSYEDGMPPNPAGIESLRELPWGNLEWDKLEWLIPQQKHGRNLATIFMPKNDIVPTFDQHVGNIHHTKCRHEDPIECHGLNEMVCDLLHSCGDGENGKRLRGCEL